VIADVFPARSRARALALYSFASPAGMAVATIGGGLIAHALGWRAAFLIVGLSGLAFAPALRLAVSEGTPRERRPAARAKAVDGLGALLRRPSFWLLTLGAAAAQAATYGMNAWLPSFFVRSFHMPVAQAGAYFGGFALIGGVAGLWLGGWLSDRLGRANRAAYALVPAAAVFLLAPIGLAATLATSAPVGFVLFALAAGLANLSLGPVAAAVQSVAPVPLRATASATYLALLTLVGMAGGPIFIGAVSKALQSQLGAQALAHAVRLELVFYLLAAALLAAAARGVARDWTD
jgi:MFS family permease